MEMSSTTCYNVNRPNLFKKKKKELESHTPVANSLSKQKLPRVKCKAPLALGDDITQQHDITISISEKMHPSVQNWYKKASGEKNTHSTAAPGIQCRKKFVTNSLLKEPEFSP